MIGGGGERGRKTESACPSPISGTDLTPLNNVWFYNFLPNAHVKRLKARGCWSDPEC